MWWLDLVFEPASMGAAESARWWNGIWLELFADGPMPSGAKVLHGEHLANVIQ